jgi:hypothetical protein
MFNRKELAMGLPARRSPQVQSQSLPACFNELPNGLIKETALEIYDTLLSLQKLRPEAVRTQGAFCCPTARLGERRARYIVERVLQGARFNVLNVVESERVKFVGPMSGVIEAVRLGAVDDTLRELFFNRIQKLVAALASPNVASVRGTRISRAFWDRLQGQKRLGTGIPTLEKLHGCWVQIIRRNGIVAIAALRVIDVEFHPEKY